MIDEVSLTRSKPRPEREAIIAELEEARVILATLASAGTKYPGSLLSDCIAAQSKAAKHLLKYPDRTSKTVRTVV